jgi:hypothetical protein
MKSNRDPVIYLPIPLNAPIIELPKECTAINIAIYFKFYETIVKSCKSVVNKAATQSLYKVSNVEQIRQTKNA